MIIPVLIFILRATYSVHNVIWNFTLITQDSCSIVFHSESNKFWMHEAIQPGLWLGHTSVLSRPPLICFLWGKRVSGVKKYLEPGCNEFCRGCLCQIRNPIIICLWQSLSLKQWEKHEKGWNSVGIISIKICLNKRLKHWYYLWFANNNIFFKKMERQFIENQ